MDNSNALTTTATAALAPTFGARMELQTLAAALEFAAVVEKSGLGPKGMTKEGIVIAIQMGYEVGLSPMQAIQNIAPINGRPAIWGDACLALVRASGKLESFKEEYIGQPGTDERGCTCTVKRVGQAEASDTFTVADAKRAGLWGKAGPWTNFPQRMLKWRARGFLLRDQFGDVLKGLRMAEEAMDEPTEKDVTALGSDAPVAKPESRLRKRAEPAATEAAPVAEAKAPETLNMETPAAVGFKLASAIAAIDATDTERADLLAWLKHRGTLTDGQGIGDIPQAAIDFLATNPAKVAEAVQAFKAGTAV